MAVTQAENRHPGTGHRPAAGLSRDALHHLTLAALLHDIGLLTRSTPRFAYRVPRRWFYAAIHVIRLGAQWLDRFRS
jgi:hypothetical protein